MVHRSDARVLLAVAILGFAGCAGGPTSARSFELALFTADITPPVGHALCGGMVPPAKGIRDPLSARGWVLFGAGAPIVFASLDWTELRNDAYDRWRGALAEAAGTVSERVLLTCIHQHDAPYADLEAQRLLDGVGLKGAIVDPVFHERCVKRVSEAVRAARSRRLRVTHLGIAKSEVDRVASNRRVVHPDGRVSFARGSFTGNRTVRNLDAGEIDPWLRMLSFWDGNRPVAALSGYSTHPMSKYRTGRVSADFVGDARSLLEKETPGVLQIYASGASGDVTAGKYNDGTPGARPALAGRLFAAMERAWRTTERLPLTRVEFRNVALHLEPDAGKGDEKTLKDASAPRLRRIFSAMGLSWKARVAKGIPIDVPVIDFGRAQLLLLPAESFVAYQLAAQRIRPDSMVLVCGYGECAPGYIPTAKAREEGFVREHGYCWVAPGSEARILAAMKKVLAP